MQLNLTQWNDITAKLVSEQNKRLIQSL